MLESAKIDEFIDLTDNELIELFRKGNQTAFSQLALRYMFVIKNKSADLHGKGIDEDDLIQEGFLALHSAVKSYDENSEASFRTYASVCIRNRLVSVVRIANSQKNKLNNSLPSVELDENIPLRPEKEPENAFIIKQDFAQLVQYIKENLSKSELKVLSMYLEGMSYDEIARVLGKSRKFCDNAMQRARKKLKNRIN